MLAQAEIKYLQYADDCAPVVNFSVNLHECQGCLTQNYSTLQRLFGLMIISEKTKISTEKTHKQS